MRKRACSNEQIFGRQNITNKMIFFNKWPSTGPLDAHLARVVRKPVNANPGLKVNRSNNFFCTKVLSMAYVLCSLRLLMLKNEGQKI